MTQPCTDEQINIMTIYDIFFAVFSVIYLPYLVIKGKAHKDFAQRLGRLPEIFHKLGKTKPVWIHAVSVGEVLAVKNFIREMLKKFPEKKIVLSTTTRTGNEIAEKILDEKVTKFYFPVDFSFVVRRVLDIINPSVFLLVETEIWPNLILELSKRKIPIVLINGRLSEKSFKGYRKIKFVFCKVLEKIDVFCMQSEPDKRRIIAMGAPEAKVKVTGNMKFDIDSSSKAFSKSDFGIDEKEELIIAGSTHGGEDEILIESYRELRKKMPNTRLLLAPRHVDHAGRIKKLVEDKGFRATLVTELKKDKSLGNSRDAVIILDTLGDLSSLYSIASIVFMGGSLIKRGGHNLVEPALFKKAILFGPYMHNFRDMMSLFLNNEAAICVKDKESLTGALEEVLKDYKKRTTLGENAKCLIDKSRGATERNINELEKYIKGAI